MPIELAYYHVSTTELLKRPQLAMEKANEIAGMGMDSDEDLGHKTSTPRLPVLSDPLWGFHFDSPGITTPPLHNFASSVPFHWEEVPGKPKHLHHNYYAPTSPLFTLNDYHNNGVNKPLTEPKPNRAERGFIVSLNPPDCMTCDSQRLENYDVNATECKLAMSSFRVIDGLVGAYNKGPSPTSFVKRRNSRGWAVRKLRKSSTFFVSMWRQAKRVVSLSRRSDYTPH